MNRLRMFLLSLRAQFLEAQVEHAEGLLRDHKLRLANTHIELRRVKSRLATITPPGTLLAQALKRRSA